jgi:hypothetical protein
MKIFNRTTLLLLVFQIGFIVALCYSIATDPTAY